MQEADAPKTNFARVIAQGLKVEDPEKCGDVIAQALATPLPVLVEALVDPHEPPMTAGRTPNKPKNAVSLLEPRFPAGRHE